MRIWGDSAEQLLEPHGKRRPVKNCLHAYQRSSRSCINYPIIFIGVEVRSALLFGAAPGTDVLFLLLVPGFMLAMATLIVRAVELSSAGIVVRYFLGRRVALAWPEVKSAELFTVQSTEASTRTVRLEPHRGRSVAFNSNLSNFDQLLAHLETNCPVGLVRKTPRQKGPLEL